MKKNLLGLLFVLAAVLAVPVAVDAQTYPQQPSSYDQYGNPVFSNNTSQSAPSSSSADFSSCQSIRTGGVKAVVGCIMAFFNSAIYLLIAAGVVYVVYGAFKMISAEEGREDAKKTVYYGIIGLFVMVSIWGLVNILEGTFKLSGQGPIAPPTFKQP